MKEKTNNTETAVDERGGLSASASHNDDRMQNHADQATEFCRNVSADTTLDTTAPRPWTPGPWATLHETINSESADIVSAFDSCDRVAVTCPQHEDGVELSNARLIAASPELFEALERLIGYADSPCGGCGEWNVPPVEMALARAALAKALGGQP